MPGAYSPEENGNARYPRKVYLSKRLGRHERISTNNHQQQGGWRCSPGLVFDFLAAREEEDEHEREGTQGKSNQRDNHGIEKAWDGVRKQELQVMNKMHELRADVDCKDTVLPARTIQKMEAICLSTVSVLKSYLTSENPLSTLSITEVISQVTLLARTAEALSRWVAGAMAILERERERAHALHRENAKVSRESAMGRKELSSMERKMIDAQEEAERLRSCMVRIDAEAEDMQGVFAAIQDSVLAAGLEIKAHDENGKPFSINQMALSMLGQLRECCLDNQDLPAGTSRVLAEKGTELGDTRRTPQLTATAGSPGAQGKEHIGFIPPARPKSPVARQAETAIVGANAEDADKLHDRPSPRRIEEAKGSSTQTPSKRHLTLASELEERDQRIRELESHIGELRARLVSINRTHHQHPSPRETLPEKDAGMEHPLLEMSELGGGLHRHVGQKDRGSPRRGKTSGASPTNRQAMNAESGPREQASWSAGMNHDGSTSPATGSGQIVSDPPESYQREAFENHPSTSASGSPARTARSADSGVLEDADAGVPHGGNVHQNRNHLARPAIRAAQATPTSRPGAARPQASPAPSPRHGGPYRPLAKSSGLGGERDRSSTLMVSSPRTERFEGSPRDSSCILSGIDSERGGSTIAKGDSHGMATLMSPSPPPRRHLDQSTPPISPERGRLTSHMDIAEVVIDLTSRVKSNGKEDSISRVDLELKRGDGVRVTPKDGDVGGDKEKEVVCERGEEPSMTEGQERALRSFLRGVDETQANLAFVALRKEPFLMEEFGHLASEIQLLHEATDGPVPRHLSHGELRRRFRDMSSRSAPLLRRVRGRYRRLHERWASKLLEALRFRGLRAGDADVSLTCSLCGYDWRRAEPRGVKSRKSFQGIKRGNSPGRLRGKQRFIWDLAGPDSMGEEMRHVEEGQDTDGAPDATDATQDGRGRGQGLGEGALSETALHLHTKSSASPVDSLLTTPNLRKPEARPEDTASNPNTSSLVLSGDNKGSACEDDRDCPSQRGGGHPGGVDGKRTSTGGWNSTEQGQTTSLVDTGAMLPLL